MSLGFTRPEVSKGLYFVKSLESRFSPRWAVLDHNIFDAAVKALDIYVEGWDDECVEVMKGCDVYKLCLSRNEDGTIIFSFNRTADDVIDRHEGRAL